MFLNIFESIGEYLNEVREKTSFDSLTPLLIGIVIGFALFMLIYVTMVLAPIRKEERKIFKSNKENDEIIKRIIDNAKNQFIEESSTKPSSAKYEDLKSIAGNLIHDIAKAYYPDSAHPIYELSADEILILNHYITNRIDEMLSNKFLKRIRKIRISSILKFIDMKKKYDENKLVKAANKAQIPTIWKSIKVAINIGNPFYWIKNLVIDKPYIHMFNKAALTIIGMIGNETNKVYSKSVFNIEKDQESIKKEIAELEELLNNIEEKK